MTNETQNVAQEEIKAETQTPEQDAPVAETQQNDWEHNAEDINWKKFREEREKERKQREAAELEKQKKDQELSAMKEAMEALVTPQAKQQDNSWDNWAPESDEERFKKIAQEEWNRLEQERIKNEQARAAQEAPTQIRRTYTDFDQVITPENIDYLEYHYPEVAKAFASMPDGYEKYETVYKAMKRFVPNNQKEMSRRSDQNLNKPQSMNVKGVTQTTDSAPVRFDDQRKKDNWARMQRVMRGH